MSDRRIRSVVILGGGTAGWMTASYLGKALQSTVDITVLEAPSIPKIGVGEATIPLLQNAFFNYLGVPEDEWMRECNAAFKIAVKFVNWRTPGVGEPAARTLRSRPDQFYHPFGILPNQDQIPLSHYWFNEKYQGRTDTPFDYACFKEPAMMDAMKAPRYEDGSPATRYAWHFDAHLLADYLKSFATRKMNVTHVEDELVDTRLDERGFITALRTKTGRLLEGDLFIDCSGFRGLLINKAMGEPFIDMNDHLLCDSAVATAVPHDDNADIEPYTSAIAMPAGWTWKIPLLDRFGSGYVFSSAFTSRDQATEDFCRLWGLDPETAELNHIRFRVGRNRRAWVKNCVAVGLSSCFVEPLESTGIHFIYGAIYQLTKHFPDRDFDPVLVDRFNGEIEFMFDDTRDFIQAHFGLSPRTDTEFWQANKDLRLTDEFVEKKEMYRVGVPINPPLSDAETYYGDPGVEFRNFWTNGSYYCIFAGLDHLPQAPMPALTYKPESVAGAKRLFDDVRARQRQLRKVLPSNADYLRRLHSR